MTHVFSHYIGVAEDDTVIAQCCYRNYSSPTFAVTHLEILMVHENLIGIFVAGVSHYQNLTYTGPFSPHSSSPIPLF